MIRPVIRIVAVIGTRPEAIKLAPVILEARARAPEFSVCVVRTGQHRELVDQLMDEFGIEADVDLKIMQPKQNLAHVMAESVRGLSEVFAERRPDWVLVQGDTTTTFAGALAGFYNRVRVGHVEAGLRTGHRHSPFPEEANRSLTACVADLHFAPTEQARANLLQQGIADSDVVVTGNTVIDALFQTLKRLRDAPEIGPRLPGTRYALVTTHRRENQGAALHHICDGLLTLLETHPHLSVWVPMHPSPDVRQVLTGKLGGHERALLTEPLGYTDFVAAMHGAALVLTDSGGVQEECAALGRPVLVLRADTERPEAVDAGVALLVGTDARRIVEAASRLLDDAESYRTMAHPTAAFGEGRASIHILNALAAAQSRTTWHQ
ncbi:MAG TPA: UDP-N-acetylglucosamine 2-epimerase (non-hydrolyzing) [Caldimonas sp.]|jgi:UDP-N-acetylglucosamine 2-epimerase (non-hydrolysing)|nr:UDP-N-acetylglucosamine 2-epimerase (non-hydrolyzing) [Caldimonas sp.]HEX2540225.1 UDP-N-acetylglucosamine 2-epimerase (non-hydrolyzing) [Caldimonas sp.]